MEQDVLNERADGEKACEGQEHDHRDALRESEERFSKAFHASPIATSITRLEDGLFVDVNGSFLGMTGYAREEVIGRNSLELHIWRDPEERRDFISVLLREGAVRDNVREFRTKTGELRTGLLSAVIIELQGLSCLLIMIRDITRVRESEERIKAYQEELRSLASQLSLVEERERRRIATELHDRIGQALAMIKIKLGGFQQTIRSQDISKLNEIRELLEDTIRSTRSLSFELSPPILYDLGLEAAVEWLAEQTQEQHGIQIELSGDHEPGPLDHALRVLLFASVRELLVNVVKHSKATKATVSISGVNGEIHVRVGDNGIGMDMLAQAVPAGKAGGFGLFSIRERIGHLGGRFEVQSAPGEGTRVCLCVPLTGEPIRGR